MRFSWGFALPLFAAVSAFGQTPADPPDSVAAGAKREILELRYDIQDLKPTVADLQVKETDLEVQIEVPADVLFDFDKSTLRSTAREVLMKAAELIRTKATGVVRISGFTDSKGGKAYNQQLSDRRANAVRDYFVKEAGLRGISFSTKGYGADNPVASNTKPDGSDDPEGRQKNRRVEIVMRKKG
jgi:outer membrane protein OmpA-like peptidoglycan-associated protein